MNLKREEQRLVLEGKIYSSETIDQLSELKGSTPSPFLKELYLFLKDWFAPSLYITVQTSGSTGVPKQLTVLKEQMMQSARLTCEFLQLKAGDTALLCMPLQYIAGKMVVVRALVAGLNLILRTPSGHPLADINFPLKFAAMVPLQVYNSLQIPEEKECLSQIKNLIIGGGAIDATLEKEISQLPNMIYSTYGMTETLSHIALRRLNGSQPSAHYHPFSSVDLSLSPDNTLIINAPLVCSTKLITNDVAEIFEDGTFIILGRKDNIINSGGIKIQIEKVEQLLQPIIAVNFAITSRVDERLGEAITLLIEQTLILEIIKEKIKKVLPKYQQPKEIVIVKEIPFTGSGKIDRAACRVLANKSKTKI